MGGVKDRLSFSLHFLYIYIYFTDAFCVAIAIRQLDRDQIREGDVSRYLSYPSIESCFFNLLSAMHRYESRSKL